MFKNSMLIKIDDFEDFSTMNEVRKKDRKRRVTKSWLESAKAMKVKKEKKKEKERDRTSAKDAYLFVRQSFSYTGQLHTDPIPLRR